MKALRGTALYCGIGNGREEMKKHLETAASVGINAVFSSLQLPESNKKILLEDFPYMAEVAHSYGMIVDADIGERTASMFGLDLHDFAAFKKLGIDYARLDHGYTNEQIVEASHNDCGIVCELNADYATDEWLEELIRLGINKEQIHFCHNYYPMRYSGKTPESIKKCNDAVHRHGFTVGGFIASQTHRRLACGIGLPTAERHRSMDVHAAVQEAFLFGYDDVFFGDDFADISELKALAEADPSIVTYRMRPFVQNKVIDWLIGREMEQTKCGLDEILRSNFVRSTYDGNVDDTLSCIRHTGDVTVCKSTLWRYAGEIQLVRQDLPRDESIGIIGRIIDEDLPLLETHKSDKKFRIILDKE